MQANDLLILLRRAPAGAAAPRQQQRQAQPARAAASTAGNPAAFNPDGSAVNPEALMQMLEGNPQQLETLPPELVAAVRAKDVAGLQVGAAWLGCVALCWAGWVVAGLQPALTCLLQKSSAKKQPALAWAALLAQKAASDMSCLATRPCLPAGGAAGAG